MGPSPSRTKPHRTPGAHWDRPGWRRNAAGRRPSPGAPRGTSLRLPPGPRIGDEALRKVERVPVRRSDYRFPGRVVVLKLYEDLPVLVGPDIGVNILTIQQIVLNGDPADAESSCVECFEALAQIEAERHIALRIIRRQWDVFQIVKRLGS